MFGKKLIETLNSKQVTANILRSYEIRFNKENCEEVKVRYTNRINIKILIGAEFPNG